MRLIRLQARRLQTAGPFLRSAVSYLFPAGRIPQFHRAYPKQPALIVHCHGYALNPMGRLRRISSILHDCRDIHSFDFTKEAIA
jgi:hypothetical protein